MNERIKELRNMAWNEAYGIDPSDPRIVRAHEVMEAGLGKFSELIVRECANVASNHVRGSGGDHGVKRVIEQHFGVE